MTRPRKRTYPSHAKAAARLREHPGMWMQVAVYPVAYSARGAAHRIRTAYRLPSYEPAGAFEARVEQLDEGTAVVARWLGAQVEADLRQAAALAAVHAGGDPR
ncbi:hypothetical protein [Streptomyces sp. NPDC006784]|uniref:hypothetical protein n=1 Tax=Streptomyces sp. NPDC006784 TaxID=3364764 RepID=UPI003695C97E